jgi:hypothetical protein
VCKDYPQIAQTVAAWMREGVSDPEALLERPREEFGTLQNLLPMRDDSATFALFGQVGAHFEESAVQQMQTAMRLWVATREAIMPDAHVGYALIGGVMVKSSA